MSWERIGLSSSVTERGAPITARSGRVMLTGTWISARLPNWAREHSGGGLVTEQIAAVAKANDGVYSPELHEAYLRAVQPDSTDREIASMCARPRRDWVLSPGLRVQGCAH